MVGGIIRRSLLFNTDRIDHLYLYPHIENRAFILHYVDLSDLLNIMHIIKRYRFNLINILACFIGYCC